MLQNFSLKLNYFLKSELNELFIVHSLRSFALSMIQLFLPIFFLGKGYSIIEVFIFFLITIFTGIFFTYYGLKYAAKNGAKHAIVISMPLVIAFFIALYNIDYLMNTYNPLYLLIILSLVYNFSTAYYWMGFHVDFARSTKNSTQELGLLNAVSVTLMIAGPLIGALIISFFSYGVLFTLVTFILLISIIPLFFSKEIHEPINLKLNEILNNKIDFLVFFSEGVSDYGRRIFWPLLIFFIGLNLKEIGGIFSFGNLVFTLFTLYIGKKAAGNLKHKILRWGTKIHSFTLIVRTLLKGIAPIALIQSLGAISFTMIDLPYKSIFYNNSKKKGIQMIYLREFHLHMGRLFSITTALVLYLITNDIVKSLVWTIMLSGVFTLFMDRIKEYD